MICFFVRKFKYFAKVEALYGKFAPKSKMAELGYDKYLESKKAKKTGVFPIKFFAKKFEIFDFLPITKTIEFNLNCNQKGRK